MSIDVSVIIVNWNTRDFLRQCLKSLYFSQQNCTFEVVVVDNASSDGSSEMVEADFPECRLIRNVTNVGFARGNNIGFNHCNGEFIFILNPDTVVLPGCLGILTSFMRQHPEAGVIGPWIRDYSQSEGYAASSLNTVGSSRDTNAVRDVNMPERWNNRFLRVRIPNSIGAGFLSPHIDIGTALEVDWVLNAASFFRKSDVERGYPMDETFFIGTEELEFCCLWMRKKKLRCFLLPEAQIIHFVGRSYEGHVEWAIRLHGLAQAAIHFRRTQIFGRFWARLDSLVAFGDHAALYGLLGIRQVKAPNPARSAMRSVYRSLLAVDLRLLLKGARESIQIDREFRKWIDSVS